MVLGTVIGQYRTALALAGDTDEWGIVRDDVKVVRRRKVVVGFGVY
jgi:hypothetical protein